MCTEEADDNDETTECPGCKKLKSDCECEMVMKRFNEINSKLYVPVCYLPLLSANCTSLLWTLTIRKLYVPVCYLPLLSANCTYQSAIYPYYQQIVRTSLLFTLTISKLYVPFCYLPLLSANCTYQSAIYPYYQQIVRTSLLFTISILLSYFSNFI